MDTIGSSLTCCQVNPWTCEFGEYPDSVRHLAHRQADTESGDHVAHKVSELGQDKVDDRDSHITTERDTMTQWVHDATEEEVCVMPCRGHVRVADDGKLFAHLVSVLENLEKLKVN